MIEGALRRALRVVGFLVALACLAPLAAAFSGPAGAHTALIGTEPADRSVLAEPPPRIVLRFTEPVSTLVIRLVSPDAKTTVLQGAGSAGADVIELAVPPGLARGTHALSWRVVSMDGHPVAGTVLFSIGAPSEAFGGGPRVDWPVLALVWWTKLLLYLGLFVGVGGVAFGALVAPLAGGARTTVRVFLATGLVAAPLSLAAQGLDALGAPLADALRPQVWAAGFSTAFGRTVAAAAASFGLGYLATTSARRSVRSVLAGLSVLGVGLALASSGHASSAPPQWATRPAVFVHGICVAFWVGALLPLGIALQKGGATSLRSLRRFSRIIPFTLAPLVLSGLLLAIVQLGAPSALWTTAYGAVFLAKLVLLALLFTLAAFNRWRLTPSIADGKGPGDERLVASIAVEWAITLLILAVVATWRFTPPPRALTEAAGRPAIVRMAADTAISDVEISPGRAGAVLATARVSGRDGALLDAKEASFVFSDPQSGIEPIRLPAKRQGDGTWRAEALLPVAGRWKLRFDLLVDDFTMQRFEGEFELRPQ